MSICVSADLAWDEDDAANFVELCRIALGRDSLCLGGLECPLLPAVDLTRSWAPVRGA